MNKKKRWELFFGFVYFLIVSFMVSLFNISYLPAALLYLGVPSLYITLNKREIFKKTVLFSLLISIPSFFIIDYILTLSKAWAVNPTTKIYLLNLIPLDDFIWAFFFSYVVVAFYEYFIERIENKKDFSKRIKYLIYIIGGLSGLFGILYFINKDILIFEYCYLLFILGMILIPGIGIVMNHPKLLIKLIPFSFLFLIVGIIYEFSAIKMSQWFFPGQYIGTVSVFSLSFPLEEILFFIITPLVYILIYEYFAEGKK